MKWLFQNTKERIPYWRAASIFCAPVVFFEKSPDPMSFRDMLSMRMAQSYMLPDSFEMTDE